MLAVVSDGHGLGILPVGGAAKAMLMAELDDCRNLLAFAVNMTFDIIGGVAVVEIQSIVASHLDR